MIIVRVHQIKFLLKILTGHNLDIVVAIKENNRPGDKAIFIIINLAYWMKNMTLDTFYTATAIQLF